MAATGATLSATWSWAPALIWRKTRSATLARGWFQALEALVRHAAQPEAGGPHALGSAAGVAVAEPRSSGWRRAMPQIEDILPLSPLQEGLLFHALYDAQGPDVYTVQLVLGLRGTARCASAEGGGARRCWGAMRACAPASSMRT